MQRRQQLLTFQILALTQIFLREMLVTFLPMHPVQTLPSSYHWNVSFQESWDMCLWHTLLCVLVVLEKIRSFQVTSALTLLLPWTCSVDLGRSQCSWWINWEWSLVWLHWVLGSGRPPVCSSVIQGARWLWSPSVPHSTSLHLCLKSPGDSSNDLRCNGTRWICPGSQTQHCQGSCYHALRCNP